MTVKEKDDPTGVLFLLDIECIHYTAQLLLNCLYHHDISCLKEYEKQLSLKKMGGTKLLLLLSTINTNIFAIVVILFSL